MLFKNPVRTSKRTPHFTITKINWLTLFKEAITVDSDNHMKPMNTFCRQDVELLAVETDCTYSYHWPLGRLKLYHTMNLH
jgi:hypothetical protein